MTDKAISLWQKCLAKILSKGPIPNHMAFILDGNRRWARKRKLVVTDGHKSGAFSAEQVVLFLQYVGVKEFTLYLFSIENFKRSPEEVNYLMDYLCKYVDQFDEKIPNSVLRVVGDVSLLTPELQQKIALMEEKTKNNSGFIFNMAIAYTCRDDISQAMRKSLLEKENVTVDSLQQKMYTKGLSPVDVLVRTSGETRLSDYLMWETDSTWLCFIEKLWPELNYWDMSKCILQYQRRHLKG